MKLVHGVVLLLPVSHQPAGPNFGSQLASNPMIAVPDGASPKVEKNVPRITQISEHVFSRKLIPGVQLKPVRTFAQVQGFSTILLKYVANSH